MKQIQLSAVGVGVALWSIFLMGGTLIAQEFQPFTKELKLVNAGFPQKIEVNLPSRGNVTLQVVQFPKGGAFFAEFSKGEKGQGHFVSGEAGQARLSAGQHTIVIREKWNRKVTGPIHIKALVTPINDTTEPNDTLAQARPVTLGETVIRIFPVADTDHLKINLKDRGYLSVYPVDPPKGFTSHCEVFDFNNQSVGSNYVHITLPGEYRIKCTDKWSRFGSSAPIKIKIEFHPEEDLAEPNNTMADAASIPLGTWQQAMIAPSGDVDFHALTIKSHGRINLYWENLDDDVQLDYQIYDEKGTELQLVHPFTVAPGKYYIKVYGKYYKWSLKPYRFKFDLLPIEKITPRGEKKTTVIEPSRKYYARIQSGTDSDRFALKLKGQSIVRAKLTIPEDSYYRMSYQLKGGEEVVGNDVWFRTDDSEVTFSIKTYYSRFSYRHLSVVTEVEDEFDPSEPNDAFSAAADLELAKPRLFFLYPNKDTDWFKIHIDKPGTYYLHVVQTSEDSTLRFSRLGSSFNDTTGKRILWPSLQARSYGFTSKPIEVKAAGDYLVSINSDGSSKAPLVVGMNQESNLVKRAADSLGGLDVFVAGVELKPDVAKRMEGMVNAGGGSFINAEKAGEIGDKLVTITEQIEERSAAVLGTEEVEKKSATRWWLWLLLAILALVVIKKFVLKKKSPEEDVSEDSV